MTAGAHQDTWILNRQTESQEIKSHAALPFAAIVTTRSQLQQVVTIGFIFIFGSYVLRICRLSRSALSWNRFRQQLVLLLPLLFSYSWYDIIGMCSYQLSVVFEFSSLICSAILNFVHVQAIVTDKHFTGSVSRTSYQLSLPWSFHLYK